MGPKAQIPVKGSSPEAIKPASWKSLSRIDNYKIYINSSKEKVYK